MDFSAASPAVLAGLGFAVGMVGTLVGVGGGFFLVPYYLAVPMTQARAVGTSLAVILLNAGSGTIRWSRQGRIDYRIGIPFAMATAPGAAAGWLLNRHVGGPLFQILFGGMLLVAGSLLLFPPVPGKGPPLLAWFRRGMRREFTDAFGERHAYEVNVRFGVALSLAAGILSAFFGIGGGFLHVPAMVLLYGMPVHVAVATTQFILLFTAAAGVLIYGLTPGTVQWGAVLATGAGAVVGAQAGAWLAPRIPGRGLKGLLTLVLYGVAARMIWEGARAW